jgi:SIR2-like domain
VFNALLAFPDSWDDHGLVQDHLADQLSKGRVALILGAGVSVPLGLPSWDELLDRMYAKTDEKRPVEGTVQEQAEFFKVRVCHRNVDEFHARVKTALYSTVEADFWIMHPGLTAIGALVMASRRGSASGVISFNFDDILEMYLEFHGYVVASIADEHFWAPDADVYVLHPHGLLPLRPEVRNSDRVVLDAESFSAALHGEPGRLWRQQMLTIMRSHTCIFVGLSGADEHLQSLLYEANRDHITKKDGVAFWGVRMTTDSSDFQKTIWGERGIATWEVANYERDLPTVLLGICQRAAQKHAQV